MGADFELSDLEVFTAGTLGPPGRRVFFLQARTSSQVVTLRLEKQQVVGLADHFDTLLGGFDVPPPDDLPTDLGFEEAEPDWIVGELGIGHDADAGRIVVVCNELLLAETEEEAEQMAAVAGEARFVLTVAQAAAFVPHGRALVEGGRPTCRLCGRPMNPEGHRCPRTNGHGADR